MCRGHRSQLNTRNCPVSENTVNTLPENTDAAAAVEDENTVLFADLGIDGRVLAALQDVGYEKPSPIQAATIPLLLEGRDVVGLAQTGTGKTAAFAVPALSRLAELHDLNGPSRKTAGPGAGPDPRAGAPGGRGLHLLRQAHRRLHRPAGLRRLRLRPAARRPAPRRPGCCRYPGPRHRPHRQGLPGPVRTPVPGAGRGRRDAAHGLRRRRGADLPADPGRDARWRCSPPPCRAQIRRIVQAVPEQPGRDHGQVQDHHGRQHPPALPAGHGPAQARRADPHPRGRRVRRRHRVRAHQDGHRGPGRQAARPAASRLPPSTATSRSSSASAPSSALQAKAASTSWSPPTSPPAASTSSASATWSTTTSRTTPSPTSTASAAPAAPAVPATRSCS